jgi:hypothetical protein
MQERSSIPNPISDYRTPIGGPGYGAVHRMLPPESGYPWIMVVGAYRFFYLSLPLYGAGFLLFPLMQLLAML